MFRAAHYPKRPVKAAFVAFLILAAFVGVFLPFADEQLRDRWPLLFAYCAFLAVFSIGLARFGRRAFLLFGIPAALALAPAVVGFALALRAGASSESGAGWLQLSLYLLYAVGAWGVCLTGRGWWLYFTQPNKSVAS